MNTDAANSLRQKYMTEGYAIIPGVLSKSEVVELRTICQRYFENAKTKEMPASVFLSIPELAQIPFREPVVDPLHAIFEGGYTIFPNFTVRFNKHTPWHIDRGFVGKGRHLQDPRFICIQCGVHLQDNDAIFGGGLDVRPRSHEILIRSRSNAKWGQDIVSYLMSIAYRSKSVDARAGDLVLWDGRLFHRGTPARQHPVDDKIVIYWSTSSSLASHISAFLAHLDQRGTRRQLTGKVRVERYAEIRSIRFPRDFSKEIVEIAAKEKINVATF